MILIRCANGVVAFQVNYARETDSFTWHCVNDNSTETQVRNAQGYQSFFRDMVIKAVALQGAFQTIVDIPEVF